jgi:hypothetical protein
VAGGPMTSCERARGVGSVQSMVQSLPNGIVTPRVTPDADRAARSRATSDDAEGRAGGRIEAVPTTRYGGGKGKSDLGRRKRVEASAPG